jgi:hypothetical protein
MKANRNIHLTTVLIVSLTALSGCASITNRIDRSLDSSVAELTEDHTHYHKILDELGPPAQISSLSNGFAFQYEALQIDEQQIGFAVDIEYFRWFKLAYGGARVKREVHTFVFDQDGYLEGYGNADFDEDVGKGVSYQFIVKVAQVVDTTHLEKPSAQHDWGFALLQPLPVTLNRAQSLDLGDHGMEQRGTPTAVGQRTLELQNAH